MIEVDDEFPIDHESARVVAAALRSSSPSGCRLVDQHVAEHGEILPTLLLDAVGAWLRTALIGSDDDPEALAAMQVLEELYAQGDGGIRTVVATGFLEALPHPDDPDRRLVERLPPGLRAELRRMEEWRPGS